MGPFSYEPVPGHAPVVTEEKKVEPSLTDRLRSGGVDPSKVTLDEFFALFAPLKSIPGTDYVVILSPDGSGCLENDGAICRLQDGSDVSWESKINMLLALEAYVKEQFETVDLKRVLRIMDKVEFPCQEDEDLVLRFIRQHSEPVTEEKGK